jgi:hypothetical protein
MTARHRHAQDRQRRLGSDHTREVGGSSGPGDDAFETAASGRFGVLVEQVGSAVGRHYPAFVGDVEITELCGGVLHDRPIRVAYQYHPHQGRVQGGSGLGNARKIIGQGAPAGRWLGGGASGITISISGNQRSTPQMVASTLPTVLAPIR